MRIYSEQESSRLVSACIDRYPEAIQMPILKYWNNAKLAVHIAVLLLSVLLGVTTAGAYKAAARSVIGTIKYGRLVMLVIGVITIIVAEVLCVCIHEFIHMLGFKLCRCKSVLVYSKKPPTFSALGIEWLTKTQALLVTVLPFSVISVISVIVFIITNNHLLLMWLLLINTALSSSDLVSFFVTAKIPKNARVLGHYYRCPE